MCGTDEDGHVTLTGCAGACPCFESRRGVKLFSAFVSGLLFGLGLFSRYREDPAHFRSGYDTLLSRAGMDTAEELGAAFGLDVTDEAFWTASLDVIRARIDSYVELAEQFAP